MKAHLLTAAICATVLAAPAVAQDTQMKMKSYTEMDADSSGGVSGDEFRDGLFSSMDKNQDQALQESEYFVGDDLFEGKIGSADLNDDKTVDQTEFRQAFDKAEFLRKVDMDNNGEITEEEYNEFASSH